MGYLFFVISGRMPTITCCSRQDRLLGHNPLSRNEACRANRGVRAHSARCSYRQRSILLPWFRYPGPGSRSRVRMLQTGYLPSRRVANSHPRPGGRALPVPVLKQAKARPGVDLCQQIDPLSSVLQHYWYRDTLRTGIVGVASGKTQLVVH
jgi:hypothetical protein